MGENVGALYQLHTRRALLGDGRIKEFSMSRRIDTLIIGAGPAGLACGIEAARLGVDYLIVDKGGLVDAIYRFPADMTFFSTADLMSVGDLLFVSPSFRPSRIETLKYYRGVADHYGLNLSPYTGVTAIVKVGEGFGVATTRGDLYARRVIVATGYYDQPNLLGIPGEEMPKVSHYYTEAHPYRECDVAVVGGKNSAVEAAMNFARAGARVTMIHRGATLSDSVKYWVRPDIEKMIEKGKVVARFSSKVTAIRREEIDVARVDGGESETVANDFVFALTGYHPDTPLLAAAGVIVDPTTLAPTYDASTLETNVPGLYVAGSLVAGRENNKVFIENSREHGRMIFSASPTTD